MHYEMSEVSDSEKINIYACIQQIFVLVCPFLILCASE